MDHFYAQLAARPAADALRQAQIATRQQYPNPFFWAPFTVYGSQAGDGEKR
jgi:CHAT domain-containing protein